MFQFLPLQTQTQLLIMNKIIIYLFLAAVFFTNFNNCFAENESSNAGLVDELLANLKAQESQWSALCLNTNFTFNKLESQLIDYKNLTKENDEKMFEMRTAIPLLKQLLDKIENPGDSLQNLKDYDTVLKIPGAPKTVYYKARRMDYDEKPNDAVRAANLFAFLTSSNNIDGFVLGAGYYWLGHIQHCFLDDITNGLKNILQTHNYPACLVFTDASYYEAAKIYKQLGFNKTALALYGIRIPNIDYWYNELWKAECSFYIARDDGNATNAVRQIERAKLALAANPSRGYSPEKWKSLLTNEFSKLDYEAIKKYLSENCCPDGYETDSIRTALNTETNIPLRKACEDMLLHAWPMVEDIDPVLLTNRFLSNNIFEHKKRTDID